MTLPASSDPILRIYLALTLYPILQSRIRSRMRRELFERGIITPEAFENELRQKAVASQVREGLHDPYGEESAETWELRLDRIRRALTDFHFAYNLPYDEFERIVREALSERGGEETDFVWFNPELAPQDMLFEQAEHIEAKSPAERERFEARLQEIKVVLIRTMVSDHLAYLKLARKWFTVEDLKEIRRRKIGGGKVGGKAAGMLLAMRILNEAAPPEVRAAFRVPVSYYLGSDVFYNFMSYNGLMHWNDQKYKPEDQMRIDYPLIAAEFSKGQFSPSVLDRLRDVLAEADGRPLIVRSSSLLEDNFGTSFAGKYDSIFCPNQADPEAGLAALTSAITQVYASVLNPDALLYRHHKGLADYDERIAILIQFVEGQRFGRYFLPQGAGVAFSRNLYRWSPQIRKEDGFLRLVWGLGTRAVDQTGNDYPRLVALSHPSLHPAADVKAIRRYSQQFVDLIDLDENILKTLPVREVLSSQYPALRYVTQLDEDGYLSSLRISLVDPEHLVVTFDELLQRTPFAEHIRTALSVLSTHYHSPVDTEFTLEIPDPHALQPEVKITLLQCRPQSQIQDTEEAKLPEDLPEADVILSTRRMVPQGTVRGIRYVVFVHPEEYFNLPSQSERDKLARAIGSLNATLAGQTFICIGPGRWGTSTPNLGVGVRYGDIYNARSLVELSGREIGTSPEPSFGTHFFQDMMEAHIYPLAVFLDDSDAVFMRDFFYKTPSCLSDWLSVDESIARVLRLIAVEDYRPGHSLTLIMDGDQGRAAAFLQKDA
jgi:hypothetical protein